MVRGAPNKQKRAGVKTNMHLKKFWRLLKTLMRCFKRITCGQIIITTAIWPQAIPDAFEKGLAKLPENFSVRSCLRGRRLQKIRSRPFQNDAPKALPASCSFCNLLVARPALITLLNISRIDWLHLVAKFDPLQRLQLQGVGLDAASRWHSEPRQQLPVGRCRLYSCSAVMGHVSWFPVCQISRRQLPQKCFATHCDNRRTGGRRKVCQWPLPASSGPMCSRTSSINPG